MALASLCRDAATSQDEKPLFRGFIVDHGLRQGSADEAQNVAESLRKLDIKPSVLTLDWTRYGSPESLSNLESIARRLRYQALGQACRREGITSLLVAHHADDQAETVLLRLLGQFHGNGLRGITSSRPMPECEGLYGVSQSGEPWTIDRTHVGNHNVTSASAMLVEGGGVKLERPLLPVSKDELIAYCNHDGVRWFEDHTNSDRSYTRRNTIRHLLGSESLPRALQKPRLQALAATIAGREATAERLAQTMFDDTGIQLDLRSGQAIVTLPLECRPAASAKLSASALDAKARFARKLLLPVSPCAQINLQDLDHLLSLLFAQETNLSSSRDGRYQIAGVDLIRTTTPSLHGQFKLQRSTPTTRERDTVQQQLFAETVELTANTNLNTSKSDWHLWDNRYWIRVSGPFASSYQDIRVRFLQPQDLARLRSQLSKTDRKRLDRLLEIVPGDFRFTLPVLVARGIGVEEEVQHVVTLPTLGWSAEGWARWSSTTGFRAQAGVAACFHWDVRYRHIDLTVSRKKVVSKCETTAGDASERSY